MAIDRFLGAGWASVHGPMDPSKGPTWTLDHGFRGLLPAPAPRPVDWVGMHKLVGSLPFRFGGVRVSGLDGAEDPLEAALGSTRDADREAAIRGIGKSVAFARRLGCDTLVLQAGLVPVTGEVAHSDLGDPRADWTEEMASTLWTRRRVAVDRALDALCRSLHSLCNSFSDMRFCLTLSRDVLGLGDPVGLRAVFEDLPRYRLGYWHDTVAAACREQFLGEDPGEVLDGCSKVMKGMTLGDVGDGRCYLPPGSGGVDYPLLSSYRQPTGGGFPVVIELDPGVDPGEIPGVHAYLDKFGL